MSLLGFKDRFCPHVEDGSKRHTVRAGSRFKAGDRADLYARPRQKGMRLMFRDWVTKVETIKISLETMFPDVEIDGVALSLDEREAFFERDGFRAHIDDPGCDQPAMLQAAEFWRAQLAAGPFFGQVIHWDYENRFMDKPRKMKRHKNRDAEESH